ncbi:type II toxin-antitoxin system HicB family antitoxin [Runella sp.]|jgi:predicted RNase H-like HicB family nuclease|uniref:type II toxin-antitoxin system HicB family antitoxin n=1 Tax=Runella sp. TaxID=1960881 RepID=UPI0026324D16|nr:type II toxin-antitoxin system HicB family antitoxin [Runella sp.]
MASKYEIIIYWSQEDEAFLAEIPELKGCIAHGTSYEDALKNVNQVASEWLKIAQEEGWTIPVPKGRLIFA